VLGPYEKSPVQFLRGNLRFQAVNSGGPAFGPDGQWYYLYNAFDAQRLSLCRQLMLDPIRWTEDGWPQVNEGRGPGERYPLPIPGERAPWRPALSDEFTAPTLEGVDGGVLGSKWLFKREDPANWSLTERPDWLRLRTACPGLDNWNIANFLCQRPNSAYYELDTCLEFTPNYYGQYAGLAVRELQSQATIAIGLLQTHVRSLCVWHHPGKARVQGPGGLWGGNSGLKLVAELPWFNTEYSPRGRIYLRILAEGLSYRAFYREDPDAPWIQAGGTYGLAWDNSSCWFTAFHPGLFAAEFIPTPRHGHADFDWFRCRDMEGEC
jgi:hypothetical protein